MICTRLNPFAGRMEGVILLDQRRLPGEVIYHTYTDYREIGVRDQGHMVIRGAPAIGVAAAMGIAIGVQNSKATSLGDLRSEFAEICKTFAQTRPTAVDLFWAIARFERRFEELAAVAASKNGSSGLGMNRRVTR